MSDEKCPMCGAEIEIRIDSLGGEHRYVRGTDEPHPDTNCRACWTRQLAAERSEHRMADECLQMVAERLTALGCGCGPDAHAATPPCSYDNWITCVVAHHMKGFKARGEQAEADSLHYRTACDDLRNDLDAAQRVAEKAEAAAAEMHIELTGRLVLPPMPSIGKWYCTYCRTWSDEAIFAHKDTCILADNPGAAILDRLAKAEAAYALIRREHDKAHAVLMGLLSRTAFDSAERAVIQKALYWLGVAGDGSDDERHVNPGQALLDELATLRNENERLQAIVDGQNAAIPKDWKDDANVYPPSSAKEKA